MIDEPSAPPPRVSIEVSDPELRAQILAMLERASVDVAPRDPGAAPGDAKEGAGAGPAEAATPASAKTPPSPADDPPADEGAESDLVILPRAEFLRRSNEVDAPDDDRGVLVISDRDDPADRAQLIAAGAEGILPTDLPADELSEAIADHAARSGAELNTRGIDEVPRLADFASRDPLMLDFLDAVRQVVDTDTPLLVLGETGVGKERLARAIHAEGPRAAAPFVAVNCGALPGSLLESELFGHEEGAFTGAAERRRGRFERAGRGTIFLDEIGEMPQSLQARLLDVLQRREIHPIGAEDPIAVEARIIAATHRDLGADVESGKFREDLFYRLHVMPLSLPPLRERPDGLPELIGRLLRSLRRSLGRPRVESISRDALEKLLAHDWPGNVRELGNVLERAILVTDGGQIRAQDLMFATGPETRTEPLHRERAPRRGKTAKRRAPRGKQPPRPPYKDARAETLERFDRGYFTDLLEECEGRIGRVAERAGIAERTVYEKLKKLGLDKDDFRS